MWKGIALVWGMLGGPAFAQDAAGVEEGPDAVADGQAADALADAEAKRLERMAAIEAAQSKAAARIVVLKWQGVETDFQNETLQRNVRSRIARPDAKFYPDVDLYQAGRREPDRSIRAPEQRGSVPDDAIFEVLTIVADVAPLPWNAMSESDWGLKAHEMRGYADKLWFIDRPELREPLFQLYVQIGRAAENANNPAPPFYEEVGGMTVNYYWYLAGTMGHIEPGIMSKITDSDLYASVDYYKGLLDSGRIQPMTIAFQVGGEWDAKAFAGEYQVFIDGLEVTIDDKDSLYKVPPGRVDVYMKRADGHSISDSIDVTKLRDKIYFLRDVAQKKMGIDFISQLMAHPNECTPELDGEIMAYLAIYAQLHKESEVYVAVPEAGNANHIMLWRWDRPTGTLQKVLDNTGGFPVRFVMLGGFGMNFSGAKVTAESPETDFDPANPAPPAAPIVEPGVTPNGLPFQLQLRGHYGRAIGLVGVQGMFSIAKVEDAEGNEIPAKWADLYQTDGFDVVNSQVKQRDISRLTWVGAGVTFGKEAATGVGIRAYGRFGWTNVPHVWDATLHGGIAKVGPLGGDGRVKSILDVDGYAGVTIPYGQTLYADSPGISPNLGLVASLGLSF